VELHDQGAGARTEQHATKEGNICYLEHLEGRCRRIFDNRAMESSALQEVIKGDVQQWQIAWSTTDVGNV
jgi:hypothetical protein